MWAWTTERRELNQDQLQRHRLVPLIFSHQKLTHIITNLSFLSVPFTLFVLSVFSLSPSLLSCLFDSAKFRAVTPNETFGSFALFWRTDWPCGSPATRTLATQLWDRRGWPALLLSLFCFCVYVHHLCVVVLVCVSVLLDLLCFKCANMLFQCWVSKCLCGPFHSHLLSIFSSDLSGYLHACKLLHSVREDFVIMPNPTKLTESHKRASSTHAHKVWQVKDSIFRTWMQF